MNSKLRYVIDYILEKDSDNAAFVHEIINKIYLSDWKAALTQGNTISKMKWLLDETPIPASEDFWNVLNSRHYTIERVGDDECTWVIRNKQQDNKTNIHPEDKSIIDFVINYVDTSERSVGDLVMMTYPMLTNNYNERKRVDLNSEAKKYIKTVRPELQN